MKKDFVNLNSLHQVTGKMTNNHITISKFKRYPKSKNSEIPKLKVSVANRIEFSDYDYLDKLSPSELEWLKKFHQEYNQGDLNRKENLHTTKKLKKDCYDRNNQRNRDLFGLFKGSKQLWYLGEKGYP